MKESLRQMPDMKTDSAAATSRLELQRKKDAKSHGGIEMLRPFAET